jgi:hypothetical protein
MHLDVNITVEGKFSILKRQRKEILDFSCGQIFCEACASTKLALPSSNKPVRVCDVCCTHVLAQCAVNSS